MKVIFIVVFLLFTFGAHSETLTEESLYQMNFELEDQDGTLLKFNSFQGKPILIGMIYASCPHVCPLTIHNIKNTEQMLPDELRRQLHVVLVSLDPETDTPAMLRQIAERQKVDLTRWKFVRTDLNNVRKLAAVLGVRFRKLPDGEINHTTLVTLLNSEGEITAKSEKMTNVDSAFLEEIAKILN